MKRLRVLLGYGLLVVLFFYLSEVLISASLNTTYDPIERKDELSIVSISQAEATLVNGRIKGTISNKSNSIKNKYLRIDLYSKRNVLVGSRYIDVSDIRENESKDFEAYFKANEVEYYNMAFTDKKEEGELPQMLKDLTKGEVFIGCFVLKALFW